MASVRSFSSVLYLLFIPLLLGSVGTTSWLAHHAGQESVEEVASTLGAVYTDRVRERVEAYLREPRLVTQVIRTEIALGLLDPEDLDMLLRRFVQQVLDFGNVPYVYYGTSSGQSVGFQREQDGSYRFVRVDDDDRLVTYAARPDLTMGEELEAESSYDPRVRPWYRAAAAAGDLTWTDVYVWFGREELCIDAVAPIYDADGSLIGVLDAGYTLSQLSRFLVQLELSASGEVFIIDAQGLLVATSTGQPLVVRDGADRRRVSLTEHDTPLAKLIADEIAAHDGTFSLDRRMRHPALGPVAVRAHPLGLALGLDWQLVVAIPESDFTAHHRLMRRQTIVLSLLALLMTILAVLIVVRRLSRPLQELVRAAERVRVGDLDIQLPPVTKDEVGLLTLAMGEMVVGLQEREAIREAFGRYVTQELAEQILSDPDAMRLGGVKRQITILMSDLRGFTARSSHLSPEQLVALLNRYLGEMTEVILQHSGLIVEFIGDAILVLFGATGERAGDALRAVRCAQAMHRRLDQLNAELRGSGQAPLRMGIGVHTGEVFVGNFGSAHRVKFGVVGDAVNTTARIESLTVGGQTMVGATTRAAVGAQEPFGEPITTRMKGLSEPMVVYALLRADAETVDEALPDGFSVGDAMLLHQIVDKILSTEPRRVTVTQLGPGHLWVRSPPGVEVMDDVVLSSLSVPSTGEVYCKVAEVTAAADGEGVRCRLVISAIGRGAAAE